MSKKSFKSGFDSLLGEEISTAERKKDTEKQKVRNEIRATFLVDEGHLEKIKAISYWDRKMIKNVLFDALEAYIKNYEKNKGEIILPNQPTS